MKKFKVVAAAACALALAGVVALVGCTSSGSSSSAAASGSASATSTSASAASASASASSAQSVELQIFAANSLSKAMEEAQALYVQANPNVKFADTQYKSSGDLVTMLDGGAYADILITASAGSMDKGASHINTDSRFTLFKNDLVIVAGSDTALAKQYGEKQDFTLEMVASGNYKVCVGDDSVPAGNYANQSLSTVKCFVDPDGKVGKDSAGKANGTDAYKGTPIEGKVVTDTSVGNVCKHAQSGDVDVAFVYTSDVYRFEGVTVIGVVPADTHKNITYPAAVCAQTKNADAAKAFLDWCKTDKGALEIWQKWGFELA